MPDIKQLTKKVQISHKIAWIYLIKDNLTGFHKIGKANNPIQRLQTLKRQPTLLPYAHDFELVEAWECDQCVERIFHEFFKDKRKRGEWFELGIGDLLEIEEILFLRHKFSSGLSQKDEDRLNLLSDALLDEIEDEKQEKGANFYMTFGIMLGASLRKIGVMKSAHYII